VVFSATTHVHLQMWTACSHVLSAIAERRVLRVVNTSEEEAEQCTMCYHHGLRALHLPEGVTPALRVEQPDRATFLEALPNLHADGHL